MPNTPHSLGGHRDLHLATVIDNDDPDSRGRIKVRLASTCAELWAVVLTNSAGDGYGVSLLPKVDEQVVVGFASPELPIVLGAVWSGGGSHPDEARPVEDNYTMRTPQGTQVRFDDANGPSIEIKTQSGYRIKVTEESGGEIVLEKGTERIEMTSRGIKVSAASEVSVEASQVKVSAGLVTVDAGMSRFSGVVQCDTLISNTVVSATYTPGAGNIW